MKKVIKLTESDLHKIIKESVNIILEGEYNQFSDSDFGGTGDPYGILNDEEEQDNSLDGYYGSFNNIWVVIKNDGKPNSYLIVGSKENNKKRIIEFDEAQKILSKIKHDAETYGTHAAIYRNVCKYVL